MALRKATIVSIPNSRQKVAACAIIGNPLSSSMFQHTAARRRLLGTIRVGKTRLAVSTLSRAEAAAPLIKKQEKSAD